MKRIGIAGLSAAVLVAVCAGAASAHEITTSKMLIKNPPDAAKRQIQAFSKDPTVLYTDAVDPDTGGASVHVFSATQDYCLHLPGGLDWTDNGKLWKYKNPTSKNQVLIGNGKLQVKIRSGVNFALSAAPQGTVSVTVQLGATGDRLCLKCTAPTKDEEKQYLAKECVAAVTCDPEPSICDPTATTTTTSTTTTTTSTTTTTLGTILKAVLTQTNGNWTYALTNGVPGADTLCNSTVAGTHACLYTELQAAEAAGDLDGIEDLDDDVVTAFWAIDPARPASAQCIDNPAMPAVRWHYATGHLGVGGDWVTLNNGTGVLSALHQGGVDQGGPANCHGLGAQSYWVGCCQ